MLDHKTDNNAKFIGNLIIRGKFKCLTGLHIGGSKEKLEIGGVDSPVVRDPRTRYPYVPGSSLKGKLRSLLEYALGAVPASGEPSNELDIVRLFGIGVDEKEEASKKPDHDLYKVGPSRLVVRDCHPTEDTTKWWKKLDSELLYTEYKSENGINRITSAANPRFIERVVKDSEFDVQLVYTVYDVDGTGNYAPGVQADLENLRMGLLLLEHNFLGKSGSRGYGRIIFRFEDPLWIAQNDYIAAFAKETDAEKAKVLRKKLSDAIVPAGDFDKLKSTGDINWVIEGLSKQA